MESDILRGKRRLLLAGADGSSLVCSLNNAFSVAAGLEFVVVDSLPNNEASLRRLPLIYGGEE